MALARTTFAVLAGTLLVAAAVFDVRTRRIPNAIVIAIAAAGLGVSATGGLRGALSGLAAFVVVFAPLTVLWRCAVLGAGDVKLMSAAAAGVGLQGLPGFLAVVAIAGGVVAAVTWAAIRSRAKDVECAPRRRASMPYGVAIAAGAMWCLAGL